MVRVAPGSGCLGFRAAHFEWLLLYFERALDEDAFIRFGNEMLDGVAAFWEGLNEDRLAMRCSAL